MSKGKLEGSVVLPIVFDSLKESKRISQESLRKNIEVEFKIDRISSFSEFWGASKTSRESPRKILAFW